MGNSYPDPTTGADRRRLKEARAEARESVRAVYREGRGSIRDAFRQEIGTNIRSVSPFLLSLVASQGESVDELVDRIEPASRWPRAPALSRRPGVEWRRLRDVHRHFLVNTSSGWQKAVRLRGFGHGMTFMRSGDDFARLEVVDHSLEVEAQIGPAKFETLFGEMRVELDDRLPETLAVACVGRLIGDVVEHAALHGRDWLITGIDDSHPCLGQTLVVATGSTDYRIPWARCGRPNA